MPADDQRFIDASIRGAKRLSEALEQALGRGEISAAELFEPAYEIVPGSNPQQVTTTFTSLTDRIFPPIFRKTSSIWTAG